MAEFCGSKYEWRGLLTELYSKLRLPVELAPGDFQWNMKRLDECKNLGFELSKDQ